MNAKNTILILAALLIALGSAGGLLNSASASNTAAVVPNCTQYYTIKAGDTLAKIGAAYNIPWRTLAETNNLSNPNRILAGDTLCLTVSTTATPTATTPAPTNPSGEIPTFSISAIEKDKNVTIRTADFPAGRTFQVRMGAMGTRGVNGILVSTIQSGDGGAFTATFDIPDSLKGSARIAIRLESTTGGYFSYNWFYNNTTGSTTPAPTSPAPSNKIPTFSISAVSKDQTVTIRTADFPAGRTFQVRMGAMGTRGVNGILVSTIESGDGGSFTATFDIPAALKGSDRIAIRLESTTGGYFSYNWFYNR
jgi:hypothetical protein